MYRSEQKFVVDENTLQVMKRKLMPIMDIDAHQHGDSYRIRSMYFDTYERRSYRENDAGVEERKKYRIRVYDNPKEFIRLEIKNKLKDKNLKEDCVLTLEQYNQILDGTLRFDSCFPKPLSLFYLDMKTKLLRPSVIVEYERTAFVYEVGNIRVTFDRNISYSYDFDDFLEENILLTPLLPANQHVFEVKFDGLLPEFIAQTIETNDLQRIMFSKFYFSHLKTEGEEIGW